MSKKFGFTLAEVLITLGIIGVVAGMTIPVLMNNINDQQNKVAYKKAYSAASQAWLKAYTDGTIAPCTQWADASGVSTCNADNFNAFKAQFKVAKDCGTNTAECWDMSGEMGWPGTNFPTTDAQAFIDTSGFAWSKNSPNPAGELLLDINGLKKPNQYGKDRFIFVLAYYTYDGTMGYNWKANAPIVFLFPDFPDADTSVWTVARQTPRCPSMNSHPCYYTSWITGGT